MAVRCAILCQLLTGGLRRPRLAFDSARSYMIAWGWSFAAIFGVGVLMIILWLLWAMF